MSEHLYVSQLIFKEVQATLLCVPQLTFLKGVAKLKGLQDEVFLHSSVSCGRIGYLDGWCFLQSFNPILSPLETTVKNAMND